MNNNTAKDGEDYRTDSTYIYHYTDKIAPNYIRTALLLEGIDLPERPDGEPLRYLELGFGQGLSLLIHAAANKGEFWGVDFQPKQADNARHIAEAAGLDCTILTESFSAVNEKAQSGQIPAFDVIVLHGVWSWVNEENRRHILDIINHTLRPGGVVYISYNAMPGWSFFMPIREIMIKLMERYGHDRNNESSIKEVLDYVIASAETGESAFFSLNPQCLPYLKSLKDEPVDYIAHEFFNSSWSNFYYHQVAADMASIGCSFAASAYLQYQSSGVTGPKTSDLLGQIINRDIKESMRDFVLDRKFRADYFVRSPIAIPKDLLAERIGKLALKLPRPHRDVKLEVNFGYSNVPVESAIFAPILKRLDEDNRSVKTIAELFDTITDPGALPFIRECLLILIGSNAVRPALASSSPETTEACRALNRLLLNRIASDPVQNLQFLASPALGAGVRLPHSTLLTLHADPTHPFPDLESYRLPL